MKYHLKYHLLRSSDGPRYQEIIEEVQVNRDLFGSEKDYLDVLAMLQEQYNALDPAEKKRLANLKEQDFTTLMIFGIVLPIKHSQNQLEISCNALLLS